MDKGKDRWTNMMGRCPEALGPRESKAHSSGHGWVIPGGGGTQARCRIEGIKWWVTHWPPAQRCY